MVVVRVLATDAWCLYGPDVAPASSASLIGVSTAFLKRKTGWEVALSFKTYNIGCADPLDFQHVMPIQMRRRRCGSKCGSGP